MIGSEQKAQNLGPICLLVMAVIAFFGKVICSGSTLYGSDFLPYFYPVKSFIYNYFCSNGSLPFWNPYLFSGTPLIGNMQSSMFYPLGFLYYLIPTDVAYLYSTILHCILGAVFMYMFIRSLFVSKPGSFLSAFVFIFNGYFIAHIYAGHLSFVQNYIWIPLVFFFLIRFCQSHNYKYSVAAGLVLGIQILGGFPQIAFYTILAIMGYLTFCAIGQVREKQSKRLISLGIALVVILCVGFCIAAVQVLPTLKFTALSGRADGVSYNFATSDSLNPKDILSFLIPDIFGNVIDRTYWKSRELWHFWETCGYVGILPLLLLFIKMKSAYLQKFKLFFVIIVLGSIFLALGKYNPLYPLVYQLPGFGSFRIPSQIIYLYVFGIAILSGIGLHTMREKDVRLNKGFAPFFVFFGILLFFLIIALSFFPYDLFHYLFKYLATGKVQNVDMQKLYERICLSVDKSALVLFGSALLILSKKVRGLNLKILNVLAIGILMADLFLFTGEFIKPYHFKAHPSKEKIISLLNKNATTGRVYTNTKSFMPNAGLNYRFPSILGYDPLILKRYIHYIQLSQGQAIDDFVVYLSYIRDPDAKLIKLLNLSQTVLAEGIKPLSNNISYINFVRKGVVKSPDEVLPFMKSDRFDPERVVVLESKNHYEAISQTDGSHIIGFYKILSYKDEKICIKTSSDKMGYLVLSEMFYPGWQAIVDGKSVPVLCGNYIFRVIFLEKGDHDITFQFVSWPFRFGAIITLLTLMGSIWFFFRKPKSEG